MATRVSTAIARIGLARCSSGAKAIDATAMQMVANTSCGAACGYSMMAFCTGYHLRKYRRTFGRAIAYPQVYPHRVRAKCANTVKDNGRLTAASKWRSTHEWHGEVRA